MVARSKVHDERDSCGEVGPAPGAEAAPAGYKPHVRPHFIVDIYKNYSCESKDMIYPIADMPNQFGLAEIRYMLK